jgi:hypothetical protein
MGPTDASPSVARNHVCKQLFTPPSTKRRTHLVSVDGRAVLFNLAGSPGSVRPSKRSLRSNGAFGRRAAVERYLNLTNGTDGTRLF